MYLQSFGAREGTGIWKTMSNNAYKMTKTLLVIPTLVFLLLFADGFKVTFTPCTDEDPVLTVFSVSLADCLRQCHRVEDCETVLYIRMMPICQLHRREPNINGDTCDRNALIRLIHSRAISSIGTRADVQYCPMLAAGANAVILGNQRRVGRKLQLTCARSYAVFGERTIFCTAPGQWSRRGECIQTCDTPIPTENMIFGNATVELPTENVIYQDYDPRSIRWFEHSAIVIGCLDDAILLGLQSITCSAGRWSELPVCKIPTMRQPCQVDDECVDTNSECRGGTCWCTPELSYNPANMTCVNNCQVYGNTFQVVEGNIGIAGLNFHIQHTANKESCIDLCLASTTNNYECKHADYRHYDSRCFLMDDVTPIPQANTFNYAVAYLRRDCQ